MADDIAAQIRDLDVRATAVEARVRAKLISSYVRLADATDEAVDVLLHTLVHGRHEETKVAAAKEILDRAGVVGEIRVAVEQTQSDRDVRLAELRSQLASMKDALTTPIDVEATEETG